MKLEQIEQHLRAGGRARRNYKGGGSCLVWWDPAQQLFVDDDGDTYDGLHRFWHEGKDWTLLKPGSLRKRIAKLESDCNILSTEVRRLTNELIERDKQVLALHKKTARALILDAEKEYLLSTGWCPVDKDTWMHKDYGPRRYLHGHAVNYQKWRDDNPDRVEP